MQLKRNKFDCYNQMFEHKEFPIKGTDMLENVLDKNSLTHLFVHFYWFLTKRQSYYITTNLFEPPFTTIHHKHFDNLDSVKY